MNLSKVDYDSIEDIRRTLANHKNPGTENIVTFRDATGDGLAYCYYALETEDSFIISLLPVSSNEQAIKELVDELSFDHLTQVLNRKNILSILENELIKTEKMISLSSILLLDIDHFKSINDTYGHAAGNIVLKSLASLVKSTIRPNDQIGRIGGEKFVIILPSTNIIGATIVAERLLSKIETSIFVCEDGATLKDVSASIGITATKYSEEADVTQTLKRADDALYIAKKNGRNRYEVCE